MFNSVTLGDAPGHLNILKDIQIFKFEYPQIFLDIRNFLIYNSLTLGDAPYTYTNFYLFLALTRRSRSHSVCLSVCDIVEFLALSS